MQKFYYPFPGVIKTPVVVSILLKKERYPQCNSQVLLVCPKTTIDALSCASLWCDQMVSRVVNLLFGKLGAI